MDMSDWKEYPGSTEGPNPEDNPAHYNLWWEQNKPKGLREKNDEDVQETLEVNEEVHYRRFNRMTFAEQQMHNDDMWAGQHAQGTDIIPGDYSFFQPGQTQYGDNPKPGELTPLPPKISFIKNDTVRMFERWALFRFTPKILDLQSHIMNIYREETGLHSRFFDEFNDVKTPSLWAYFYTLPRWVRDNDVVRNIFLNLEHHTPRTSMRDKEIGLNLAASLLLPLDEEVEKMVEVVHRSHKYQLNCQRGEQMLRDMPVTRLNPDKVGWEEYLDNTLDP